MSESNILVGTASWTDATLLKSGRFYPADAKSPEDRLRYYAGQFPIVEVDSTFYSLPSFNNSVLWVNRTPDGFLFDVKLFRVFTLHQTPLKAMPSKMRDEVAGLANKAGNLYYGDLPDNHKDTLWSMFLEALEPLKAAGKLGYVLLQLPPWATKKSENVRHLEDCLGRLDGYTVAVEFRNSTWLGDRSRASTVSMLREMNVPMVTVDEPQGFSSSMPLLWESTSSELAVFRLHGHNDEMWTKKNLPRSALRFNYLYSQEELRGFVEPVRQVARQAKQVHVMFNNCYEDKAQRNARDFMAMLED